MTTDGSPQSGAPFDPAALERFGQIWEDSGYVDPTGSAYVLFDGCELDDVGDRHAELLDLIETLGLEHVDAPPGAPSGEVWVSTDPRVDAELEH